MKKRLSGTALQLIAVICMTADHIAAVIMRHERIAWSTVLQKAPILFVLRAVGRAAFPIFAFLLVQGMAHTQNRKRYILRLGAFALISELPFDLAFYGVLHYPGHQNIFFTLLLGALCIALFDELSTAYGVAYIIVIPFIAQLLKTDYAALGVVTILLLWQLSSKGAAGVTAALLLFSAVFSMFSGQIFWFSFLALPLLLNYNGRRGGPSGRLGAAARKWGFYLYYPAHLLVLAFWAAR